MGLGTIEVPHPNTQRPWRTRASHIVMPGALDNQPDAMLPRKGDSSLYVLDPRGVDDVDRISLAAAPITPERNAGVIVPLLLLAADRVVCVELLEAPAGLDELAFCRIDVVCSSWSVRVADSAWRSGAEKSAVCAGIEAVPRFDLGPGGGVGRRFARWRRGGRPC
jgi:hypothetical protein